MEYSSYSWAGLGSTLASLIFLWSMLKEFIPFQLEEYFSNLVHKVRKFFNPYITISIPENINSAFSHSEAYTAAKAYLSGQCVAHAHRLMAEFGNDSDRLAVGIDDYEEVVDEFGGAKLWWYAHKDSPRMPNAIVGCYPRIEDQRTYQLTFHKQHRQLVQELYLPHVIAEGRAMAIRNRQRRLFTNNPSDDWCMYDEWSHVKFEHPSTFNTLGMDPAKKQEIIDDLEAFRDGKEYYAKIGKVWKRGYLLYGPPGTGKTTMIAAMANFLDYDVYDLELTTVKKNTELRRLFIETKGKSIIVIEDIDCSIDLTGKRKKSKEGFKKRLAKQEEEEDSKLTLSGLLNFIDGLWSACGGERIIVFTTNHIENLDPALIRRGRMDKHIEMSYCCFEAFKVLANNYLDVEEHHLYNEVRQLLEEVNMTPADVAENLMPKSKKKDADSCLESLLESLKVAKEDMLAKAWEANKEPEKEDGDEGYDSDDDDDDGNKDEDDEEEDKENV